ncbi:MAG: endonuclease/exonuclease/phosphatase family protein [Bacteroidaceae bacterium]|nr:endonuclease/exonuclease/phosphatase family protein [Bacteroidaceae bacterium]
MRRIYSFLLFAAMLLSGSAAFAQDLIEGYTRVLYPEDIQEGKAYFIISDRTKFAGNATGIPKGMSYKLDKYKITWDKPGEGIFFVYWGDFDETEEGFQWIAEKVGDDKWAFKNKVKEEYLGVKNSYDDDVLFSSTPVGYTLTDLEDGAGRFYMISDDSPYSIHVQGFLNGARPNNSLAKQTVGFSTHIDDVATNGYPARWQIYEVDSYTGNPYISYVEEIQEGEQYYIVSDRTKFNGNSTGLPKGMACQQDNFKIKWGSQYVYWADLDKEADGFIWTAEKVGEDGQWAFKNKENEQYLGNMNMPAESDIIFSSSPIGYTLTDLEDGAGRFFMTNEESEYSPHVQGYLRSDRPNNSLAKQNVGDDDYPGDGATYGYPGRWKLMKVKQDVEPQKEFYTVANGYYNIMGSNSIEKSCWTESIEDYDGSSLIWSLLNNGDPFSIYRIEAVDREKGQYTIRNYVTEQYVGNTTEDGKIVMTDEPVPFTFRTVQGNRKSLYICNAAGDTLFVDDSETCETKYIFARTNTYNDLDTWKLQKVDATTLESPSAQLRLQLARKVDDLGHWGSGVLSEEQARILHNLRNNAYEAVLKGVYDIIYERYLSDLDAAMKGEYTEPFYDKFEKQDLRVLSYNVRHGAENHGNLNLPRTASVIAAQNADVVALQEVDSVFSSRSDNKYQIKELAEATGMYGIFCSALTGYGIGILSKELPLSVKVVSLTSDFEPRRMLMAEYEDYVFASLHVGLSANARRGTGPIIKAAAESWVETGKPLIIAGDFNDDGTDDEMQGARGVLTQYLQENGFTFHSDMTTPTWSDGTYIIDHIISYNPIGGVEKVSYEVVNDKVTSDHMPILGDLIIGFDDPTSINNVKSEKASKSKVYGINGTLVSDSAENFQSLPDGIYIFNGKKMKK